MSENLKIAVVGAGGKMGMRVSNNLQRTDWTVFYCENGEAGRQRVQEAGREVVPTDDVIGDVTSRSWPCPTWPLSPSPPTSSPR